LECEWFNPLEAESTQAQMKLPQKQNQIAGTNTNHADVCKCSCLNAILDKTSLSTNQMYIQNFNGKLMAFIRRIGREMGQVLLLVLSSAKMQIWIPIH